MSQGTARNTNLIGPASSTDNAIARWDSTTGTVIQNSGVTIDDSNVISSAGLISTGDVYTTAWTAWTPTITGSGGGTPPDYASNGCRYTVLGKKCWYVIQLKNTSGGTGGVGADSLLLTLPLVPSANIYDTSMGMHMGNAHTKDGAAGYNSTDICLWDRSNKQVYFVIVNVGTTIVLNNQNNAARTIEGIGFFETA